jgi:hypothetical protein
VRTVTDSCGECDLWCLSFVGSWICYRGT